ncbi:2-hexaprenyl-6-methoxy-1,4-benzoquinone methyltransferase [Lecanora helva]
MWGSPFRLSRYSFSNLYQNFPMISKRLLPLYSKPSHSLLKPLLQTKQPYRCLSCTRRLAQQQQQTTNQDARTTHFGFETLPEAEKQSRVGAVFTSVASSYDTMNDLMSLGIHRLWKDHFVRSLNPGIHAPCNANNDSPQTILDIAGGTGDIAFRLLDHATLINNDQRSRVIVSDINPQMLSVGKQRSLSTPYARSSRLDWLEANAENLNTIPSGSIDIYTVAFGIRNFTDKRAALREAFRVLKPGGVFACLEFSKVSNSLLNGAYKRWSFGAIPLIGQLVAGDRGSYQYLVESIERFPVQGEFAGMIAEAGFLLPERKGWADLTGGIAAVHKGVKPVE